MMMKIELGVFVDIVVVVVGKEEKKGQSKPKSVLIMIRVLILSYLGKYLIIQSYLLQ